MHENFIAEAIEGVLMQDIDFDLELIIADDCSPDGTEEIVQNFINNHPNGHWIKYHRHEKNIGMIPNFLWALEKTKGKYIALCEGDDYWTDPLKLQKQLTFLEKNEDIVISFHRVNYISNFEQLKKENSPQFTKNIFNIADLIEDNFITTLSVVYRNIINNYDFLLVNPVGDYPLYLKLCQFGNIYFHNEIMGTYRRHEGGVWVGKSNREMLVAWIKMQDKLIINSAPDIRDKIIENQILRLREYLKTINFNTIDFYSDFKETPISLISLPVKYLELKNLDFKKKNLWRNLKRLFLKN